MHIPRWFFFVSGGILVLSGLVRLGLAWPRRRPPGPRPAAPEEPLSRFPRHIGMLWSGVYVAVGTLVLLYAAGLIASPGGK